MTGKPDRFTLRSGVIGDLAVLGDIDADAGALFEQAGLFLDLPETHEFQVAERRRWKECLAARTTLIAMDGESDAIGFAAVGRRDGTAYLAQLSVRSQFMRRGIGSALLEAAAGIARSFGARTL
jgi:GNAT superfamily N-acetyltransferase